MSEPEKPHISSDLKWEDVRLPDSISLSEFDEAIISVLTRRWQKTAAVIAKTVELCRTWNIQIDYEIVGARLCALEDERRLQGQGNLEMWRHSEVRLPDGHEAQPND
jgi:hypothetical protein